MFAKHWKLFNSSFPRSVKKKKKKEKKHVKPICNSENKDDVRHFFVYYEKITELTDAKFPPEMTPLS